MTALRAWFAGRSLRERRLILVMLALAAVTVLWGLVIRPVRDGLADARERHAGAVMRLGETRAAVATLRYIQRVRTAPLAGSLADTVRARADAAGFTLASLDQDAPDRVRVTIQSARPAALSGWLAQLERGGILIDSAAIKDNGDRTVGVSLTLRARAA